jgi:hypothetical protein
MFTLYVNNEDTAKKMLVAASKLNVLMVWQWVHCKDKMVIACDYHFPC